MERVLCREAFADREAGEVDRGPLWRGAEERCNDGITQQLLQQCRQGRLDENGRLLVTVEATTLTFVGLNCDEVSVCSEGLVVDGLQVEQQRAADERGDRLTICGALSHIVGDLKLHAADRAAIPRAVQDGAEAAVVVVLA